MEKVYRLSFVFLLLGLFLAEFFHPIAAINVDLGRHILFGKIIVQTHHVPKTNLLSYTNTNFPYINTSWLTDVMYYYLFLLGGFNLLLVVNIFFIAFAFGSLVCFAIKKYFLSLATLLGATLYLLLLGLRFDIRPEVISMVCLSLFMLILFSCQKKGKVKLFYLIPIEILWVNMHIYYFVGPLLVALFFLDELIVYKFKKSNKKMYIIALVGTLLATLINPNGIQGALFPLTVLQNYGFPVVENQSLLPLFTTYHSTAILLPVFAILSLFIVLFLARKNTRPIDWLLAIVFSIAAISIFRNILLFVFATFLPFTTQLNFLSTKYRQRLKKLPPISYFLYYPLSLLLLFLFIVVCISKTGFGFGVEAYGKNAVDFLIAQKIQGPFYNNFDIGDYLSYRIYPQLVFVDNRPEAYPVSFFQKTYILMQNNSQIFKKLDRKYHFNAIVIEYWDNTPWGYKLLGFLVDNSDFKLVYVDQYTIILVRNTQVNKALITRFLITKKNLPMGTRNNPQELVHYLFFFEKVGWMEQETTTLKLLRKGDPNLCILTQYPLENTSITKYIASHRFTKDCSLSL